MMNPTVEVTFAVLYNFSFFLTFLSLPFHPFLNCAEHLERMQSKQQSARIFGGNFLVGF